ncbi:glycosyl hydrolase [Mucilaginibacter myungsuensis]|uniref:Alpha-L-rhamnosidase-like protein n=1 Tax=Mucilaginibacter myungsuensis TaxID=649104 RepID=A0A929KU60_9SPHI|nr:glycosyl hydrolase [Mucilaginibacter myungsuensis]MBE9661242.1 hypothetical protein [Mucilaginibacter myungsuensis]MDN3597385.1 glycosyl hydrolase [Mucilaginibacter myungsuensis]
MYRLLLLLALLTLAFANRAVAQDALTNGFKNPPPAAKPRTWWHWIDGNISKPGLTADLEAMKRVGIQEAQIFNVGQGYPEGPAIYLSPQWLDLFSFAVTEAKRLGMEISFHNGPGWSSSGGPWVTPENAMQTVVYTKTQLRGSGASTIKLPKPKTKFNYYKDIAVIAFPTPKSALLIDKLDIKSLSGEAFRTHLDPDDKIIDKAAIVDRSKVIDLSLKMAADGTLDWTAPDGDWTIIRFGHTANGMENHPAGKGGRGLEVNKMSRAAVDAYWASGLKPILDKVRPMIGNTLTSCIIDSYEVGCDNWTPGFDKEFAKRHGYQLTSYLPTLAGYYVESGEVSERFLWDFRKTIGDLMAENYFGHFSDLCHQNGLKFSVEPYGGPFPSLKVGATGDINMGEFWLGLNSFSESSRLAASIAHLKGNPIVGAEAFTSFGGYNNHPATLKPSGDRMWTEGVTRFIFHTYVHQPWNVAPGLSFHMYGVEMGRMNTWWEQSRVYMDYLARSQYLLQRGRSFADVLLFTGESSPNDGVQRPDIKAMGYDTDQIGPDELAYLTVKNGRLITKSGLSYRLLILPETKWASPALMQKLKGLAAAGATIIGPKPFKSPSLDGYPMADRKITQFTAQLWDKKIRPDVTVADVFKNLNLAPDFSGGATGADLNFIHRVAGADDIYFVSNPKEEARTELCRFRVTGKQPQLWNASTGDIQDAVVWKQSGQNTIEVPISFDKNGAIFVIFRKAKAMPTGHIVKSSTTLQTQPAKPLAGLKLVKAEYGTFLPDGVVDVTDAVAKSITNTGIRISANNGLSPTDPFPGSIKELRLEYDLGGQRLSLTLVENEQNDVKFDNKEFKLIRALYGKFPLGNKGVLPKYPIYDVIGKVKELVSKNTLTFMASDAVLETPPARSGVKRELRMTYITEGDTHQVSVQQGAMAHLEQDAPQPQVIYKNGNPNWVTPYAGKITYTNVSGLTKTAEVSAIPNPLELTGPWDVSFQKDRGAPANTSLKQLTSWPLSDDEGIRYFSGTAVYKKQFSLTADMLNKDNSLELDLGSVRITAEVIVNGKNLGTLWNAPFRISLGSAVHIGINDLEIRVTNLWVNRLIGDESLPDDVQRRNGVPAAWPTWLTDSGATRVSKRLSFTTWKHWDAKSTLQPSGLLGPVVIRSYKHKEL